MQTGPFTIRLQTALQPVARVLRFLYADYSLKEDFELVDFHIRLKGPTGIRRLWRAQAQFLLDGHMPFHPLPVGLGVPLLEWGMNWCIANRAHQFLIFHSAVVEREGRALLITAPPGSGKSTLCAALSHRGWRLLADELALVELDSCQIAPLPRPIGLKNNSIAVIREFVPEAALGPEWSDTHKGTVAHMRPPSEAVWRAEEKVKPFWIIFLTYRPGDPPRLEPVRKSRAFMRVADSAFNYSILGARGFEIMARLIDACDCYEFSYGNLNEAVERLAQLKP